MGKPRLEKSGNAYSPWDSERGIALPFDESRDPRESIGRALGGQRKTTIYGEVDRSFRVVLNRISTSNKDSLIGFIEDSSVNYAKNSFTFYPEGVGGPSHTVIIVSALGIVRRKGSSLWNAQFTLLREIV